MMDIGNQFHGRAAIDRSINDRTVYGTTPKTLASKMQHGKQGKHLGPQIASRSYSS